MLSFPNELLHFFICYNITLHIMYINSGEIVLAIRLHKLAVALGVFIVSAPAFSHGHHSHGKPLTEVEQKLLMVFLMIPMYKPNAQ